MKAIVLKELGKPCELVEVTEPVLRPGGVIVKPLYSYVLNFSTAILGGMAPFKPPVPFTPGPGAVAVVDSVADDVVGIKPGQVVFCTPWMTSQINDLQTPGDGMIQGWFHCSPTTKTLDSWKDGMWSEKAIARSTNVYPVHPDLCNTEEKMKDLAMVNWYCIALGAVQKAGMDRFGKVCLVNGASGQLGQCAVHLCLAYGAQKVFCVSRSVDTLKKVYADFEGDARLVFVTAADLPKMCCDAVIDFLGMVPSGEQTQNSIGCLKGGGTIVLCGGVQSNIEFNYGAILGFALNIRGSIMYGPDAAKIVMGLMMSGRLKLPRRSYHVYPLEKVNEAIADSWKDRKKVCLIQPNVMES